MHARNLRDRTAWALALLVPAAVLAGTALAATPEFDAALRRAADENKPLVLDFYTDW